MPQREERLLKGLSWVTVEKGWGISERGDQSGGLLDGGGVALCQKMRWKPPVPTY